MNLSTIFNFIISNWYLIVAAIALIIAVIVICVRFFKLPSEAQLKKIKEWLIWACIEAEHELKSGTGKAKLAKVYNAFISIPSFSWVSKVLTFDTFSKLVDESLEIVKQMIVENEELAKYVYDDETYKSERAKLIGQIAKIEAIKEQENL